MKLHNVTLRLRDGTAASALGPRFRVRVEGCYRYFVVHPRHETPDGPHSTITEERTGLRLGMIARPTRNPREAKQRAASFVHGLLEQGLGPRINSQIELRSSEVPA